MMRVLLLIPALLLGGCISLLPEQPPPPRVYVLEAGDVAPVDGGALDAVIGVAAPTGERSLLGGDLIWRERDELILIDQAQWSSRAEAALQSMLVDTLSRQGRFRAATRSGEARSDYDIRWDVLDFEVDAATMTARFAVDARLVALPARMIIAQRQIVAEAPVTERTSSAAANALARAAREGSARIGVFAAEAAAQASAASISR